MPYDVGEGIADGARNFFQMRLQKQIKKEQDKYKTIEPIIKQLEARLADKTVSFDEKREIANHIFQVYTNAGIKIKLPDGQTFADILIPQHITDQYIDTGETENREAVTVTANSSDSRNGSLANVNVPLLRRKGEMSQADIELGLERKHKRGLIEDDLKRDKEFAKYTSELNLIIANKAYTKNPEEVVEPTTGRTWSIYTNPDPNSPPIFKPLGAYKTERGELITQPTENTIPASTYTAMQRAKAGGGGLPATMKSLIFAASRELGLPADNDEVLNLAAERYKDQYLARTGNLNLGITKGEQATGGKEPVQPVERERIDLQKQENISRIEGLLAGTDATIETETTNIEAIDSQIAETEAAIKRLREEEGLEETDKEIRALKLDIDRYKTQKAGAERRRGTAKGQKDRYSKQLETLQGKASASSNGANSPEFGDKEDERVRAAITKLNSNRKKKNLPELDDEAAKAALRAAGFKIP